MSLPRIAVTTGDPAGIGPEVCLKLLANPEVLEICQPIIFGMHQSSTRQLRNAVFQGRKK